MNPTKKTQNIKSLSETRGIFITFEGGEGCGKTTQLSRLASRLRDAGNDVFVTREPGGTSVGEAIRNVVLSEKDRNETKICSETELLLFAASRAQLVREVIIPKLESGTYVLCDRFLDSSTVYQGAARLLAAESIRTINEFAAGSLMPDLTIVVDIPEEVSKMRVKNRASGIPDRIEQESIEFYKLVRDGYLVLAQSVPERFLVVDGLKPREKIEEEIWNELCKRFS